MTNDTNFKAGILVHSRNLPRHISQFQLPVFVCSDIEASYWVVLVAEKCSYFVPETHPALSKFTSGESVMFTVHPTETFKELRSVDMLASFHLPYFERRIMDMDYGELEDLLKSTIDVPWRLANAQLNTRLEQAKRLQFELVVEDYLDTINIEAIVTQIKIERHEGHRFKPGDDDIYTVDLFAKYPQIDDEYIKSLFPKVQVPIYGDSGFQSWQTMKRNSTEDLEETKREILRTSAKVQEQIRNNYNREVHRNILIKEYPRLRLNAIKATISRKIHYVDRAPARFFENHPDLKTTIEPTRTAEITYGIRYYHAIDKFNPAITNESIFKVLENQRFYRKIIIERDKEKLLQMDYFKSEVPLDQMDQYIGYLFLLMPKLASFHLRHYFQKENIPVGEMDMYEGFFSKELRLVTLRPIPLNFIRDMWLTVKSF